MREAGEDPTDRLRQALKAALEEKRAASAAVGAARRKGEALDTVLKAMTEAARAFDRARTELREAEEAEGEASPTVALPAPFPPHLRNRPDEGDASPETGDEGEVMTEQGHDVVAGEAVPVQDWQRWVSERPDAGPWHDRRWSSVFTTAFGSEDRSLVARAPDGELQGVLPLFRLRSRLFGDFLVSSPFLNGGGPLARTPRIAHLLLERATHLAGALGVDHVEVREFGPRSGWPARTDKVSMVLPLPADAATFEAGLASKVRSQAGRGERAGGRVRFGNSPELLDDFYTVFSINMRDLGTPAYGKDFFEAIVREFGEAVRIGVVHMDERPVGAAFLMQHRDTMEIPWASTLRRVNREGVGMLLYREALLHAIESGCRWFDFGRSTEGSGTCRFKAQWGAMPVRHHWHYWMRDGAPLPGLNPESPKFRLAVRAWRFLPLPLANRLGPRIVRHLP